MEFRVRKIEEKGYESWLDIRMTGMDALKGRISQAILYRNYLHTVKDEYQTEMIVYPPADDMFNAFHLTPLNKVKVVILGQDPYHNVRIRHMDCAFPVLPGVEEAPLCLW